MFLVSADSKGFTVRPSEGGEKGEVGPKPSLQICNGCTAVDVSLPAFLGKEVSGVRGHLSEKAGGEDGGKSDEGIVAEVE